MENVFDYEDIQLIPVKCIVNSRSECDTSVRLGVHLNYPSSQPICRR